LRSVIFRLPIIFIAAILLSIYAKSQSFNYVHYDVKEGLAGSTVYDVCQDRDGFLWFATENGLSRFDGTRFTNFTVADGLPDNEVLKTYADSKGRVWFGAFGKEVSYYYKNRIWNKKNEALLNNPILRLQPVFMLEDIDGNILITDYRRAAMITPGDKVIDFTALPEIKKHNISSFVINACYFDKGFFVRFNDSIFQYKEDKLIFYELENPRPGVSKYFPKYFRTKQDTSSRRVELAIPAHIITTTNYRATAIYQSTIDGAWSVDTILNKLGHHFLPGHQISKTLVDHEQNVWFATLGEGVYKLPSAEMRTINFIRPNNRSNTEVYTIAPHNNFVLVGLGSSKIGFVKKDSLYKLVDYSSITRQSANPLSTNRLYCSYANNRGAVFLGFDAFFAKLESDKTIFSDIIAIKAIEKVDDEHLVVANFAGVVKLRQSDLRVVDTIWQGRCTEVFFHRGKYFVGTMNGLYEVDRNKHKKYLGEIHPAFKRKISDIKVDDKGNLFVATIDMGLVVLHNNNVIEWITDEDGLTSNICRSIFIDSKYAWVGTSAGISKIDLNNYQSIVKYGTSDGLPSDNINAVFIYDSTVWVGTASGLTFFNESRVMSTSQCRLVMDIQTQGKMISPGRYELSHKAPHIQFDFVGISYKSGGDILYNYRVIGLDTTWSQTTQTTISFAALPAGNYTFELFAVNKFGVKSNIQQVYFSISQSFWKSWWFYASLLLATIFVTAWFVNRRNVQLKKRLYEEDSLHKQVAELEQQALQAQMNPGFIFNSLNSIQQYIQQNEKRKANQFLTGFAYLIRQTLDMTSKKTITLSEEIQYLTNFLTIEKMKQEDQLHYSIEVDSDLRSDLHEIPPLILQPFLEDAVRNVLNDNKNEVPVIDVRFGLEIDAVVCSIRSSPREDQGGSLTINEELKEYPLKAVLLAKKRIDLLNALGQLKIQVDENYSVGDDGRAAAEVIIKIPVTNYAGTNPEYYHR
jgi:ligand-binding sensor domain-containing protein